MTTSDYRPVLHTTLLSHSRPLHLIPIPLSGPFPDLLVLGLGRRRSRSGRQGHRVHREVEISRHRGWGDGE
jgi:hypothetical protein